MRGSRLTALLGALTMAACSSYNRSTGDAAYVDLGMPPLPDRPPETDVPTETDAGSTTDLGYTPGVFTCERLCARLGTVTMCMGAQGGCETACRETLMSFPVRCREEFVALFNCVESAAPATFVCADRTMYPFATCGSLNMTAVECARR